jgi:hypothetical protein
MGDPALEHGLLGELLIQMHRIAVAGDAAEKDDVASVTVRE